MRDRLVLIIRIDFDNKKKFNFLALQILDVFFYKIAYSA